MLDDANGWRVRQAVGRGVGLAVRLMLLPMLVGARAVGSLRQRAHGIPAPPLNLGMAAKIAADELFLASEILGGPLIAAREGPRVARELLAADALYRERGWLDDPRSFHVAPPPPTRVELTPARAWGSDYQHARYESAWEPHAGEPGGQRWQGYQPIRTAHAWILRHRGPRRPWLVCAPGYRMGTPAVDFWGFKASWLHRELGLNLAVPVLPFHGPRRVGLRGGDGFLSGDLLDTIHAQAQAVWDIRRLIAWLRADGAPAVGLYGLSLGGYTTALVAGLEEDLDCVIAGIPASDWVGLVQSHAPRAVIRATEMMGIPWERIGTLLRVVSPLALAPRTGPQRRFLFAGTADRLIPPDQAQNLWKHWGRPRLDWYHGSHVSFFLEPKVQSLVLDALGQTGLLDRKRPRRRRPRPRQASRPTPAPV